MTAVRLACGAIAAALSCALVTPAFADTQLTRGCTAHFTSAKEGAAILGRTDAFVERLSPFDRAARMKTDRPVSTTEYLEFVRRNVAEWSADERAGIDAALAKIRPSLEALQVPLPASIAFIKTTGAEEGNAFYTRATAIVIPAGQLEKPDAPLEHIIGHELFHVVSRRNPALREALYRAIGFAKCPEVTLPRELANRKITNPDAPANDHAIKLQANGRKITAVPIIVSSSPTYDVARGGEFFSYLQFGFLPLERGNAAATEILKPENVTGFFEQVGRNTTYIIHPEEILAENFALLVQNRSEVPSPEVLQRIRAVLAQHGTGRAKSR
ncbi:MAG TPA: hypothetical protein VF551_04480 [Chthoniobacterales bacterium]